jgi:hypothetical protein
MIIAGLSPCQVKKNFILTSIKFKNFPTFYKSILNSLNLKLLLMATSRQVKCINKTDRQSRHERIGSIGGDWGKISEAIAIIDIEKGAYSYFTLVNNNRANVIIATHLGRKYLKTDRDTTLVDNLLSLNECP